MNHGVDRYLYLSDVLIQGGYVVARVLRAEAGYCEKNGSLLERCECQLILLFHQTIGDEICSPDCRHQLTELRTGQTTLGNLVHECLS